ncbi:MAG: SH3 domain-containing protein [Lachnospiraceae bacterium]|nr:SH3 domain-containing protein [Lachnospiraceae bacterium]
MGKMDNPVIWDKIQRNAQEARRLAEQKKYNLSMIKSRQTLEYIVKLQCDKAGIVEGSPDDMIRQLYAGKWVSKPTAEHYLQILALGVNAAKTGDGSAANANQALKLLTEEVYAMAGSGRSSRPRSAASAPPRQSQASRQTATSAARRQQGSPKGTRRSSSSRSRKKRSKAGLNGSDLIKLLIPVVLIVILLVLIRVLAPKKTETNETTPAPTTTEAVTTEAPTTAPPPVTTEAPTTPPETEPVTYKTTDTLNVRKTPALASDNRIGKLDPNKTVEYVGDYDDTWAIILYNGQQAYVSKEFLTEVTE